MRLQGRSEIPAAESQEDGQQEEIECRDKGSRGLTAVKETKKARKSSSTRCLATRILSLRLTKDEKASCAIIYKKARV